MPYCKMDDIRAEFVAAAELATETGFDAVELHIGHGYLLSQFLSPIYNHRKDGFGGALENRLRYPIQILESVLEAVGKDLAVLVKISMTDGHPAGYGIEDGVGIAEALESAGAHMIVLSNGLNAESVSSMFGSNLPESVLRPPRNIIERKVLDWLKISGFEKIDFEELYLLEQAIKIRDAVTMPLCYLGGVQSVDAANAVRAQGFEAIAMGRALIHDPALIASFQDGTKTRSGCTACNECVAQLHAPAGVHCVLGSKPDPADHQVRAGDKLLQK